MISGSCLPDGAASVTIIRNIKHFQFDGCLERLAQKLAITVVNSKRGSSRPELSDSIRIRTVTYEASRKKSTL